MATNVFGLLKCFLSIENLIFRRVDDKVHPAIFLYITSMNYSRFLYFILLFACWASIVHAQQVIDVTTHGLKPNSFEDATPGIRMALQECQTDSHSILSFPKGRYDFWPDQAEEHTYYISNSSSESEYPSKRQRAGLYLNGLRNTTIEGNGSTFIFHGKMISWLLDSCENIRIQNVSVDYERPGMSEFTLLDVSPTEVLASIHPDSRFSIIDGTLEWYGERWLTRNFHAVLVDSALGLFTYSDWAPFRASAAEVVAPLTVKFVGDFSGFKGQQGEIVTIRDRYRDYVGALVTYSKNISLDHVHMKYMHGLGIISQFSENLSYRHVTIAPDPASGRVIASSADGMQFSGCKGNILVENCQFNGMHDDAINVHGTHLKVVDITSPKSIKVSFMHGQTYGINAFRGGDSVAFVHPATLQAYGDGVVAKAVAVSEREIQLELTEALPAGMVMGDVLENTTWTPQVTVRGSRIAGTNTRGVLVTTRRKVLIEHNTFYRTGMHAILIENDASGWFESGPVTDVVIRNNLFQECGYNSAPDNYVIKIAPQNRQLVDGHYVHKNIRIDRNTFIVHDSPLLSARSTSNLLFGNNRVVWTDFLAGGQSRVPFSFVACTGVHIKGNSFDSRIPLEVNTSEMEPSQIKVDF